MKVHVRLFASARELAGFDARSLELSTGDTVEKVWLFLESINPLFLQWKKSTRVAVNMEYATNSTSLKEGDEVALIPPVSGG